MNASHVCARWLSDNRRSIAIWTVAAAIPALLYLSFWNSLKDLIFDKLSMLPAGLTDAIGMQDLTSAAGYTQSTVYQLLGLLIVLIFAISQGARAIAGDEESGALEFTLAHATDRAAVVRARAGALAVMYLVVVAGLGGAVTFMNSTQHLGLAVGNIWAGTAAMALLAAFHGFLAYAIGAATGRRSLAIGVATAVAALGYLGNNLGIQIAEWVPKITPFYWAYHTKPLANGVAWGWLALAALGAVVFVGAALVAFGRRDIRN